MYGDVGNGLTHQYLWFWFNHRLFPDETDKQLGKVLRKMYCQKIRLDIRLDKLRAHFDRT